MPTPPAPHIKKKPEQWAVEFRVALLNANGWGNRPGLAARNWDEPITQAEFRTRKGYSTTERLDGYTGDWVGPVTD